MATARRGTTRHPRAAKEARLNIHDKGAMRKFQANKGTLTIINNHYPLVNEDSELENHHHSWVNQLFIYGPCSITNY